MRKALIILVLTVAITGSVQAGMRNLGAAPTATWSVELSNNSVEPRREVIVKAWYPLGEATEQRSLILLAPGRGMPALAYARLSQYLASHGFVVVGVDSPGSGRQVFADGRVVPPDPALKPPPGLMAGPYIEVDRFFADAATAGASDLAFVLDHIASNAGSSLPFADSVNTDKVGLLGHSLGGRIAGAFAASDARAAAWLGVEGLAPRAARRLGLGIPAMAILGEGVWPYAIANVRELAWCARQPTYLVKMRGMDHNSIVDDKEIGSMPDSQQLLAVTIRVFFEHHMSDADTALMHWPSSMSVERYDAASGARPPGHSCND